MMLSKYGIGRHNTRSALSHMPRAVIGAVLRLVLEANIICLHGQYLCAAVWVRACTVISPEAQYSVYVTAHTMREGRNSWRKYFGIEMLAWIVALLCRLIQRRRFCSTLQRMRAW